MKNLSMPAAFAIALALSACASNTVPDHGALLSDDQQFEALTGVSDEPNYIDPNTGQTFYCTGSVPRHCAFALAKANYRDRRTGLVYFCPSGATIIAQCLELHE